MVSLSSTHIDGYTAGRWKIDPTHSEVSFTMRHTLIQLRGHFAIQSGSIVTGEGVEQSHCEVVINPASFWSGSEVRDAKIRSLEDFLHTSRWPEIRFQSRALKPIDGRRFILGGVLTCRGISKDVTLDARFNGFGRCDLYGLRMGFSATTRLDRRDFGISTIPPPIESTLPLDEGPSMLGCQLNVDIQVEAVLENDEGRYRW